MDIKLAQDRLSLLEQHIVKRNDEAQDSAEKEKARYAKLAERDSLAKDV